jgi:hypothetical protein
MDEELPQLTMFILPSGQPPSSLRGEIVEEQIYIHRHFTYICMSTNSLLAESLWYSWPFSACSLTSQMTHQPPLYIHYLTMLVYSMILILCCF